MRRRSFLQSLPLDLLGAAAVPASLRGQHPGFAPASGDAPPLAAQCRYAVEDGAITVTNGAYFNNRPLYCAHRPAAALGGDRPLVRLIAEHEVCGTFCVGILRGASGKWLHQFDSVRMEYRCGRLLWRLNDRTLPGLRAVLEAVPFDDTEGFTARLRVEGAAGGDAVVWSFGGAHEQRNAMWALDPVLMAQDDGWAERLSTVLQRGFEADACAGNEVRADAGVLAISRPGAKRTTLAACSAAARIGASDAGLHARMAEFAAGSAAAAPLGCGVARLEAAPASLCWAVLSGEERDAHTGERLSDPRKAFESARAAMDKLGRRATVKTPDARLDAAVHTALHPVDAIFYPPVYRHGGMAWNVRLPAWRTMYGGTVFGWHERVLAQGKFYIATQVRESKLTTAEAEPKTRLCEQSARSRLNGLGRIPLDSGHYDFQSQFFDQLIHAWRWTGDVELEHLLKDALELHAIWMRECFDPDGDGLYESYINTWPTDTVWYNGGGSVEESSYAHSVHRALADMASRAGDATRAEMHRQAAAKIRAALARGLWVKDRGHYGAYVEQGGHRRVHEDAWLYSQFLPIDAGICSFEEAAQALFYTEWALENVRPAFGGRRVWTSNWVPSKWSARELYHGDNYHLALACFQTGMREAGWEILKANLLDTAFARVSPGSQSMAGAGTDFADILQPFCRVVVEGLFGYAPDLPNGVAHVRPGWPDEWPEASIETPDFSLRFRREGGSDVYELKMAREAAVEFRIPIQAERVTRVLCNGAAIRWTAEPGPDCSFVKAGAPRGASFQLRVEVARRLQPLGSLEATGRAGEAIRLAAPRGELTGFLDPQNILEAPSISPAQLRARLANKPGHHLVLLKVKNGELSRWVCAKVRITDQAGDARRAARTPREAPDDARWIHLDLEPVYNGDIRAIFKQQYLSPRPATVSVRLGVDGYSPWTFAPWKLDPPEIDLTHVPKLIDAQKRIVTPQNARFALFPEGRNIAFTSLWDNWPDRITVPAGRSAEAAWLLVAGSTNPMQTRIANAVVRFRYKDGVVEDLDLVPPLNFWSLCHLGGRDYSYERDGFCLPTPAPPTAQLGNHCRAMVLGWKLRPGIPLESITLEALSQEVVIGLMGASLMNATG